MLGVALALLEELRPISIQSLRVITVLSARNGVLAGRERRFSSTRGLFTFQIPQQGNTDII